jgi:hypothetical protein
LEVAAMIDMHAHWRPAELADALNAAAMLARVSRSAQRESAVA